MTQDSNFLTNPIEKNMKLEYNKEENPVNLGASNFA